MGFCRPRVDPVFHIRFLGGRRGIPGFYDRVGPYTQWHDCHIEWVVSVASAVQLGSTFNTPKVLVGPNGCQKELEQD